MADDTRTISQIETTVGQLLPISLTDMKVLCEERPNAYYREQRDGGWIMFKKGHEWEFSYEECDNPYGNQPSRLMMMRLTKKGLDIRL